MLVEPNLLKHTSQIEFVQKIMQKHGEHKGRTCGQYVETTTETAVSLPNMYIWSERPAQYPLLTKAYWIVTLCMTYDLIHDDHVS